MLDRARWRGSLLGALVGDCLGAPFEGRRGPLPAAEWARFDQDDSRLAYTDDTSMTVAFAESLLRVGGLDEDDLAAALAAQWAAAPGVGYSERTAELLGRIRSGTPWRDAHLDDDRPSNGAAMRVAPAALFAAGRVDCTVELARRSAVVTHRHPGAWAGACVQAVAVAIALRHPATPPIVASDFADALRSVSTDPLLSHRLTVAAEFSTRGDADEIIDGIGCGLAASESVPAAVCAFLSHPTSFVDAVALAVRLGSDADTVASMTGAIAGALLGESAIPERWVARTSCAVRVRQLADALHSAALTPER